VGLPRQDHDYVYAFDHYNFYITGLVIPPQSAEVQIITVSVDMAANPYHESLCYGVEGLLLRIDYRLEDATNYMAVAVHRDNKAYFELFWVTSERAIPLVLENVHTKHDNKYRICRKLVTD
jgi:hypothetical protein